MLNASLCEDTFRKLREIIYDNSGIFIPDTKKYLIENRLISILKEKSLSSYEDYLRLIKFSSNGNEIARLFDAITTNETYFFREVEQLNTCVEYVVPKLIGSNKKFRIRLWSAACSTGEEPFTVSMMLKDKFGAENSFEIHGSDISEGVLASADRAVYSSYSVRNIPAAYLQRYFKPEGNVFQLNESIKESVKFRKINITKENELKFMQGMDIIFCRNLLIYFDVNSKKKAVSNLYNCLNPGGYLFIGATESLHNVTRAFRPEVIKGVIIYRKV